MPLRSFVPPSIPVVAELEVSILAFVTALVSIRSELIAPVPIRAAGNVPVVNFAAL